MKKLSISDIRYYLFEEQPDAAWLETLRQDERKGVRQLISRYDKHREAEKVREAAFLDSLFFENQYREQGFTAAAGVDEVGRGPLAGPVTAAAAILPRNCFLPGLTDSKKLKKEERNYFYEKLTAEAVYHIVHVPADVIDDINIYQASRKAMKQAVEGLREEADILLVDAVTISTSLPQLPLTKGDERSASIAAASVLAKVERDRYMSELTRTYPEYGFDTNAGYGTAEHLEALNRLGPTPEHRRSFAPVRDSIQH
ncbi:ribonuclease HII [Salibacterium halotolerans]|uniref:Ribonuclease HII n=1 Tax=Salibacterium halotolerans TaxID=1884432 RepID=A0A1I5MD52_9BACI|nr:ribonuclease HII [Salibacterium halotolerans]SFP06891.1 RNase HII [Salibacterium halotolerans]